MSINPTALPMNRIKELAQNAFPGAESMGRQVLQSVNSSHSISPTNIFQFQSIPNPMKTIHAAEGANAIRVAKGFGDLDSLPGHMLGSAQSISISEGFESLGDIESEVEGFFDIPNLSDIGNMFGDIAQNLKDMGMEAVQELGGDLATSADPVLMSAQMAAREMQLA